ncbi:MAG: AAA family ATPase [Candidatus Aminicenantes bacterium]|jgi:predicted ATPase
MNKIKSVKIKGLRGIKEEVSLDLETNSLLLYGDNGSGKSSITDAFEWFYTNRIDHLVSEEIGRSGLEALRNIFLKDDENGMIDIRFTNDNYNSEKSIFYKKESLKSEHTNQSEAFAEYLKESQKENLLLRYNDMVTFILDSKKGKLETLSDIIGFSRVSQVRDILRKTTGELARELKRGNFDNRISNQQAKIIENLGSVVTSEEQLVNAVNELLKPLDFDRKITRISEIDEILSLVKKPEDSQAIELQSYYNKVSDWTSEVSAALDTIENQYKEYHEQFQKITGDIEKINKILLENLLNEGVMVIKENVIADDLCPLCMQPKNKSQLLKELEARIIELEQYKKEKLNINRLKESLNRELKAPLQRLNYFLFEKYSNIEENRELKESIETLKSGFENYSTQLEPEISPSQQLKKPEAITIDKVKLNQIADFCKKQVENLRASKKDDQRFEIQSKLLLSREAYLDIQQLKKEKESVERQQKSFELIYSEFLKKQKQALESFLSRFSNDINDFYQFMNPDEKVEDIKLIPLEKEDELQGLTLEFKFFENSQSPPQKYLSESHLNCLGIAFFLTSVKAFNKRNKFFILDDVISGFDTIHGKRFAQLLLEKFSDYQIILMTHENHWFELVKNLMKEKGWNVITIKWDDNKGTFLPPAARGPHGMGDL